MSNVATERTWTQRFWLMLGLVTLARILYLTIFPYDLVGDEAYYWDWGRELDWGYFSKPPMIAWLMALFDWLGGGSQFGLKLAPILFGAGTATWLFLLARRLFNARAAFWTGALMFATVGNLALNTLFTIDAPLLFCWTGGLYAFWRIVEQPREAGGRLGWAFLLLLLLGCGLLSKQMMLAFFGMALGFLAFDKSSRWLLVNPLTWIIALVALAFLLPPLLWNMQHDWITLKHMEDHFQPGSEAWVEYLVRPLTFVGLQIVLGSIITGVLLFGILISLGLRWTKMARAQRLLLWFSVPGLLVVLFMSLRQSINANWPAVFYPGAYMLLGAWGTQAISTGGGFDRLRGFFKPGVYLGVVLSLAFYAMPFVVKAGGWEGHPMDPGRRMEGWSEIGREAGAYYSAFSNGQPELVIATGHRHTMAELGFYLPGQPRVYRWLTMGEHYPEGFIESQYEIWGGPDNALGKDALIIWPGRDNPLSGDILEAFTSTEKLGVVSSQDETKNAKAFTLYKGNDFQGWNR